MEILEPKDREQYGQFVEAHPNGHILQSPEWGKVKTNWKWEAVVEKDENGKIVAGMSVLIRKIPGLPLSMMYSPRGPVCDPERADLVCALFSGMKAIAKKHHAFVFRAEPNVPACNTRFRERMEQMGFRLRDGRKDGAIQKPNVFRLNVSGKTEEEVLAQFTPKTRYNIRVALRHRVSVRMEGAEKLGDFLALMEQTGARDGFRIRSQEYFHRILDELGRHARLYMAYYEGEPVAGAIAVRYGDKTWYLYGASSNRNRFAMPNYLLQWEMIKWAIESGCSLYDFRGADADPSDDNPLYGLYRFKKGFGGDYVELIGEFDFVYHKAAFAAFETAVGIRKFLRSIFNLRKKWPQPHGMVFDKKKSLPT